jgi:hypothetical protein
VQGGDSTDGPAVARLLEGESPFLIVADPPAVSNSTPRRAIRAGLNGCGPVEASGVKRTTGHTETSIWGDTNADWSDAFALKVSSWLSSGSKMMLDLVELFYRDAESKQQRSTQRQTEAEGLNVSLSAIEDSGYTEKSPRENRDPHNDSQNLHDAWPLNLFALHRL